MSEKNGQLTKKEEQLLKILNRASSVDLKEVTGQLDWDSHEVFEVGNGLYQKGYRVLILDRGEEGTSLSLDREENVQSGAITIDQVSRKFRIAFLSELRLGSKQQQLSLLHWLYTEVFPRERVDFVVLAGGVIVGKPTTNLTRDMFRTTAQQQAQYVIDHFPENRRFKTYVVSGRRELSFVTAGQRTADKGFDAVRVITSQRKDLVAAGDFARTFDVKGVRIRVMAPWDDNTPKGKSYGPQNIADNLAGSRNAPDIVVLGGMHIGSEIPSGGMRVFTVPSFHSQMYRQEKKNNPIMPDVGCLILELNFTNSWKLKQSGGVRAHHIPLMSYVQENDYLASARDVIAGKRLKRDERIVFNALDSTDEGDSFGSLKRLVGKNDKTVRTILDRLRSLGVEIVEEQHSNKIRMNHSPKERFEPLPLKYDEVFQHRITEMHVSDTHYGSNHELPGVVKRAYRDGAEAGVEIALHSGDVTDGPGSVGYRGHANDVQMGRLDDMLRHTESEWPKQKKPNDKILETDIISGNHDAWVENAIGADPIWMLSYMLPDYLNYCGSQVGYSERNGVFHKLVHPAGGLGYTRSAKLEKHMMAMQRRREGEGKPRVLALGNWHVAYLLVRDTVGLLVPCFKDTDDFHETRALVPDIGMWVLEICTDKKGSITRVISDYYDYQHLVNQINQRKSRKKKN